MQTEYLKLEKDKLEYTVVMKEDVTQLGEVVVTGYQDLIRPEAGLFLLLSRRFAFSVELIRGTA